MYFPDLKSFIGIVGSVNSEQKENLQPRYFTFALKTKTTRAVILLM